MLVPRTPWNSPWKTKPCAAPALSAISGTLRASWVQAGWVWNAAELNQPLHPPPEPPALAVQAYGLWVPCHPVSEANEPSLLNPSVVPPTPTTSQSLAGYSTLRVTAKQLERGPVVAGGGKEGPARRHHGIEDLVGS
jgi:hypothetical protein